MTTPLNKPQPSSNKFQPCLDLTLDAIFKHFFKKNEYLCKDLLKQFIPPLRDQKIALLSYIDSSLSSDKNKDKKSILDILVQINDREKINIEMQCLSNTNFKERILFYWSKLFSGQLKSGDSYDKLCPTYSLIFTKYNLFKGLKSYCSSFSLRCDEDQGVVFSPHLRVVVVELCKLRESLEELDRRSPGKGELDRKVLWSYFIKNCSSMTERDLKSLSSRDEVMDTAVKEIKWMSREESLQALAEAREKERRDRYAEVRDGFNRGVEKGIKQGFNKGVESGISQNTKQVALKMIREGITRSIVSKVTGLSLDELSKLKKELS